MLPMYMFIGCYWKSVFITASQDNQYIFRLLVDFIQKSKRKNLLIVELLVKLNKLISFGSV